MSALAPQKHFFLKCIAVGAHIGKMNRRKARMPECAESARNVARLQAQQHARKRLCALAGEVALPMPPHNGAAYDAARSDCDVRSRLKRRNQPRNVRGIMREISINLYDHVRSRL